MNSSLQSLDQNLTLLEVPPLTKISPPPLPSLAGVPLALPLHPTSSS
ncbi:uncharacterized protein J3R85_018643 [Psidium guajava]|nr:uncharacterized protein J3R85_018643 [Psidium guajava]